MTVTFLYVIHLILLNLHNFLKSITRLYIPEINIIDILSMYIIYIIDVTKA